MVRLCSVMMRPSRAMVFAGLVSFVPVHRGMRPLHANQRGMWGISPGEGRGE